MELHLEGKLVVVTGSTKGIGKAIAKKFVQVGAHVIVNGRVQSVVDEAVKELSDLKKGKVCGIAADVGTAEGANLLLSKVKEIGSVDVLINNTGIFDVKEFVDITDEEWLNYFNVNVMSGVRLCRSILPQMLAKNSGCIITISSEVAEKPAKKMIAYSMTKAAQVNISRGLAELTKGTNVRVNSLLPGPTYTEGVQDYLVNLSKNAGKSLEDTKRDYFKETQPNSLLQRFIDADEIANVCVFMSSPCAAAITGSAIRAEGGLVQHI